MLIKILTILIVSALIYLAIALGLIVSQRPEPAEGGQATLDFEGVSGRDPTVPRPPEQSAYRARDGAQLRYRYWPARDENAPLLVLLHGSGWHGGSYVRLAGSLAADGAIAVAVPDLRGHGAEPERRGDIDYIGQFEDDIFDLFQHLRKPEQPIVLAGHSSGGGLVVRYAGGAYGSGLDGAVLIAPFLQHDAPTTRQDSGGWATVAIRRIIGLAMLNTLGIKALNGLPVIAFNFPEHVLHGPLGETATQRYSYRLNTSFAPRRNWKDDLSHLPPFLLIAGRNDEAFFADRYEATISSLTKRGTYRLIDGVGHLGIVDSDRAADEIRAFVLARSIARPQLSASNSATLGVK